MLVLTSVGVGGVGGGVELLFFIVSFILKSSLLFEISRASVDLIWILLNK